LTNGTLLSDINVRQALENSNLVVPTLNSLNKESFRKINRPHQELSLDKILTGLTQFKKEFKHEIWLEVFIIPGINDNAKELAALKDAFKKIQPDKIQLNSLARPGTESWVSAPNKAKFKKIADFFQPYTVEIVNKVSYQKIKNQENKPTDLRLLSERILATLQRRPSRKQDLVSGLNVSEDLLLTVLKKLIAKTKIIEIENQNEIFYKANF
ncbi:MAG: radical SAM protein, partial [Candidatus Margulisiibacteriota bacterium]